MALLPLDFGVIVLAAHVTQKRHCALLKATPKPKPPRKLKEPLGSLSQSYTGGWRGRPLTPYRPNFNYWVHEKGKLRGPRLPILSTSIPPPLAVEHYSYVTNHLEGIPARGFHSNSSQISDVHYTSRDNISSGLGIEKLITSVYDMDFESQNDRHPRQSQGSKKRTLLKEWIHNETVIIEYEQQSYMSIRIENAEAHLAPVCLDSM